MKDFKKRIVLELGITVGLFVLMEVLMKVGVISSYYQGILMTVCINVILTVSLNVTAGFLGELALGHAAFMAIGAYCSAYLTKNVLTLGALSFPVGLLLGGLAAGLVGLIVCLPTLRLRGDYLAIITLAFGEIIRNILNNFAPFGKAVGLSGIPKYSTFEWAFVLAAATVLITTSLIRSRHGRALICIREDEIAAESAGINTNYYKILAFVFSAFFAGIGGALYAHYMRLLQPSIFSLDKSIEILVMVVLGGMGSIKGSVISAVILTLLPELLRSFSDYRMLMYSVVLIVMMLVKYAPQFASVLNFFTKRKEKIHE